MMSAVATISTQCRGSCLLPAATSANESGIVPRTVTSVVPATSWAVAARTAVVLVLMTRQPKRRSSSMATDVLTGHGRPDQ